MRLPPYRRLATTLCSPTPCSAKLAFREAKSKAASSTAGRAICGSTYKLAGSTKGGGPGLQGGWGDMWIKVKAGWLEEGRGPVAQPIPYGAMPRLALAMISTLARRYKTREVPIGESEAQILKLMGMDDKKNRYVKLREQMYT